MGDLELYAFPSQRDVRAAEVRRQLDAQAARLDGSDAELAEMIRCLRETAIRSITKREAAACA